MSTRQEDFFEKLYRGHFNEVELHALRIVKNRDDAQIVAQDTFHIAWEKIDAVMISPNPIGWLKVTAKNVANNMARTKNRQIALFVSFEELEEKVAAGANDELDETYAQELLETCSKILSKADYDLFRLIALDGLTYVEAADKVGISMWACYKRVERLRQKLQKLLENEH